MRTCAHHHHRHLLALSILLVSAPLISSSSSAIEFPIAFSDDPKATLPLVLVKIGTPAKTVRLYPDTSSDISWVFCDLFERDASSTFRWMYEPGTPGCEIECYDWDTVQFTAEYEDGSSATGDWAYESVSARTADGREIEIEDVAIGCGDRGQSNFTDADGVLALSRNSPSFARQMADMFGHDVFSYALRDGESLVFGEDGRRDGYDLQYVRLAESKLNSSLFTAEVAGLFMGDVELAVERDAWKFDEMSETGGIVFDTGATMTYVPEAAFHAIVEYLMETYGELVYFKTTDTEVCFAPYSASFEHRLWVPQMRIRFVGGGEFAPRAEHLYYRDRRGMTCLNVWPIGEDQGSIIGSLLQRGFYWEFDLSNGVVGFAPLD